MINISSLQAPNSTFSSIAGHQFNLTVNNSLSPEYIPPQRVNDAPTDLLTANFIGRLRDLEFLSQAFDVQKNSTEYDVPTRCAVHGMPGVGKTKLVLRFSQIVFLQLLYSHIFWMSAAAPEKLIEGMTKILDIVGHPERTRAEQSAKLTAARLWLEDSQRLEGVRWLLILDNVDRSALEFLREHLPRRNVKGNILFTTRAADVADALANVPGNHSTLDLRVPDLVETTDLLFSSAGIDPNTVTPTQKTQAQQLIQNLGFLPLAVAQAASYMRQTKMTLDNMLEISKGDRKIEMVEWESDLATDQQRSVVATFDTLLDQLERDFPESYYILRVLSFLDPESIPLSILSDGAQDSLPLPESPLSGNSKRESSVISRMTKWAHIRRPFNHHSRNDTSKSSNPTHPSPELRSLVSLILSPTAFPKALQRLQSLSLVEPWSRDGQSLRMHDLVHFLTQEHVKRHMVYEEWLKSSASLVCGAMRRIEDPELPQWWPQCENLMPHVRSLSTVWTGVQGVNLDLAAADVRLARYLNSRGRYDDAERACERSLGIFRKELGDRHKTTLSAFYQLARVYYHQGRFTDAEEAYKHVLAAEKKDLGADHVGTLTTMNNLALVYINQGRSKEAEELYRQVLASEQKTRGPDHPDTLMTMHNLASVYDSQGRYDEAEKLFKHVLFHSEKHLGPDHVDTLTTANNLAAVYQLQTKYTDAEELLKRVLVVWENQLGSSHPYTLTAAGNLAYLYESQARNNEAEQMFLRAFTGRKEQLGPNHFSTLQCADAFADFYRSQGRDSEADALLDSIHG